MNSKKLIIDVQSKRPKPFFAEDILKLATPYYKDSSKKRIAFNNIVLLSFICKCK